MIDKPAATRVVNLDVGTTRIQEYPFGLDHVDTAGNREKIALVNFFDMPGAMTSDLREELKEKIAESQIVINAIDTGVMMKLEDPDAEDFTCTGIGRKTRKHRSHLIGILPHAIYNRHTPVTTKTLLWECAPTLRSLSVFSGCKNRKETYLLHYAFFPRVTRQNPPVRGFSRRNRVHQTRL